MARALLGRAGVSWLTISLFWACSRPERTPREQPTAVTSVAAPAQTKSEESLRQPAGAGEPSAENDGNGITQPCVVLAIGDSLTDPKSAGGGFLTGLTQQCNCQVVNLGKGGDMVNQMKTRLLAHLANSSNHYSDVLVFGGVNDLYSDDTAHRTVGKITSDLTQMYASAKAHGARVIAVTVTPWGGFKRYFSAKRSADTITLNRFIAQSQAAGLADYVVDAYSLLSCGDSERLCDRYASPFKDGLHFGRLGHQALGAAVVRTLGQDRCSQPPDGGPTQTIAAPRQQEALPMP